MNRRTRAWVQIDAAALLRNHRRVVETVAPGTGVLPMVKADAYGLGMAQVVARLEPEDPWGYGVAAVAEGVTLREAGVTRPVVVCSPTPPGEIAEAVEADLQISVSSLAGLERIGRAAEETGRTARIHADVDTGMGRSGFDWREVDRWLPVLRALPDGVEWIGCYTHLHSADEDEASTAIQAARFRKIVERFDGAAAGTVLHVLNSAGIFRAPSLARSVVRPGIFLYGGAIGEGQPVPEPVASVHARVVHVRDASPGTTLGYGATYRAETRERWATLSIGYGDGLPRCLGNRGQALLQGVRVPIIGRISMDVTVVDISGVPEVDEGDVATLIGSQGESAITLDEVAGLARTISYEILTGLTGRLPRVWSDDP